MRPHSNGSSTIGVKKSVVTTMARSWRSRYTAASSLVSRPTSRAGSRGASPRPRTSPSTVRRSAGDSLHAQPAPCENAVSRTDSVVVTAPTLRRHAGSARADGADDAGPDRRDLDHGAGVGRMDHAAVADVDAHVAVP